MKLATIALAFSFLIAGQALGDSTPDAKLSRTQSIEFYERKIRPVFAKHCYRCHSSGAKTLRGKLRLDSKQGIERGGQSGGLLNLKNITQSKLLQALSYQGLKMPPSGQLPDNVVADVTRWIANGAILPDDKPIEDTTHKPSNSTEPHFAFHRVKETPVPVVKNESLVDNTIDRFIVSRLEQKQFTPNELASKEVLLRRLYFDLTGLPPTLAQQDEFLGDKNPSAYERLVDRLLSSTHFGERWGRHWLDLARYSESNGSDRNVIFHHAWRYNRYVIDAFNADRPFNEFVREQIAGDLMASRSQEQSDRQLVATGYLTLGAKTMMDDKPERYRMDRVDEQIDVISRSILGLTISCARCHDHKFDPISTNEYYAMAGIFRSTYLLYGTAAPAGNQYGHDRPLQPIGKDGLKLHGPSQEWQDDVASQIKARNKARSDRYRVVRSKNAAENKLKMAEAKLAAGNETVQETIDTLKSEIEKLAADIKVWDEKIKQLDEALKQTQDNPPPFPKYAMAVRDADTIEDCQICIAGEYNQLDEKVARGVPSVLAVQPLEIPKDQSGRLQLADWLASRDNPLTARVAVNRIWQHLFGSGLVSSVDNFGVMGDAPSHPQLLDWLAFEFMHDGWSTKRAIRRIVMSRTYRLSSVRNGNAAAHFDPQNRLLWKQNERRLEAEPLRDAMLAISGELDTSPPKQSVLSSMKDTELNQRVVLTNTQLNAPVRTIYLPVARQSLPRLLKIFDFADPSLVIGKRADKTTPAQQLFLLNDPFVMDRGLATARRLLTADATSSRHTRIRKVYRLLFARQPSAVELSRAEQFLENSEETYDAPVPNSTKPKSVQSNDTQSSTTTVAPPADARESAWAGLCHALLATAEFRYIE